MSATAPTPDLFPSRCRSRPAAAPPKGSRRQRLEALERANEIRCRRARFKRDLKASRDDLASRISNPPAWLESAKVFELLLSLPKVGRVKAQKTINGAKISPSKTVGGLSERQRGELVQALEPRRLHPSSWERAARAA